MSWYQRSITRVLNQIGRTDIKPAHVEGFMRLSHGTLDALSREEFDFDVKISVQCIDKCGVAEAEELAASYGLGDGQ